MKRFQHLVVNLSLADTDAALLAWTSRLVQIAGSARVTLIHAWQPVDLPGELLERYPWLVQPGEEVVRERMNHLISSHLQVGSDVAVERRVVQENPLGAVLSAAVEGGADLVVCGRSTIERQLSERLARKAPCAVFSVPPEAGAGFSRVLAPVDYSEFSRQSLDVALAFAAAGGASVTAMHAFSVHWGQSRTALSRDEFVADLRAFHERRLREFVEDTGKRGVAVDYWVAEAALTSAAISDVASRGRHDLVVIGCRGHDAIYATLLGSTAEAILQQCPVPVVAVKEKVRDASLLATLRALWT